jgi:hypothetical protein
LDFLSSHPCFTLASECHLVSGALRTADNPYANGEGELYPAEIETRMLYVDTIAKTGVPPPTLSPDGQWMWDGYSWIPAPPQHQPPQSLAMQDSVVAGDVNITQNIGVDGDSIMSMMITELEKFDPNQSGFHIPTEGFSSSTIIAGIDEIMQNVGELNRLSTDHLMELCTALE